MKNFRSVGGEGMCIYSHNIIAYCFKYSIVNNLLCIIYKLSFIIYIYERGGQKHVAFNIHRSRHLAEVLENNLSIRVTLAFNFEEVRQTTGSQPDATL